MTTNSFPENESTGAIALPKTSEIEAIYELIEQNAREQYKPQLLPKISPRLTMLVLATVGVVGALIGSADLKVDTTVTFDTKLGQRTQPHWLVPKGARVVRTDTGAGAIKGIGWLIGGFSGAALWHVAGNDERWQRFVGTLQTQWVEDYFKRNRAMVELQSMAALQMEKQRLDREVNVDLAEQTWQFHQAIGYDPLVAQAVQNALPYGTPGTYDDVNDPGDKVEGDNIQKLPKSEPDPETKIEPIKRPDLSKQDLKLPPLTDYPAILVFGAPGGGKSTFGHEIVDKKLEAGHRVIVLDPHYKKDAWAGCEVYGKAFDYEEIDAQILDFAEEVKDRYRRLAEEDNPIFEPLSIVADEFTMWGKRCTQAGLFLWQCVTDIRKVNCFALIIGHTNTLTGLGGKDAAGAAKLIKDAVLEIEVIAKQDPDSGRAVPAFLAFVKLPGMARKDSFGVRIEEKTGESTNVDADKTNSVLVADLPDELSEDIWEDTDKESKDKRQKDKPPERGGGRLVNDVSGSVPEQNTPDYREHSGTPNTPTDLEPEHPGTPMEQGEYLEQLFAGIVAGTVEKAVFASDFPLEQEDKLKLAKLVIALELGQERTILLLWGVRRGGRNHALYAEARTMLERLLSGEESNNA